MKKIIIYFLFLNLLSACESAREGFSLKKEDNSDEFLVEKKNPLVMPPDYENLPKPEDFQSFKKENKQNEFEEVINNTKNVISNDKSKKTSIEQSVIEKIN
tara:strand:- start:199 stop:501 length:303 start_codon:yes stop_codon:yes gene_type:complete